MNNNVKKNNVDMTDIIRTYGKNIQSLIMSITGKNNVHDLEQEIYIKIWKNFSNYKNKGNLWSWIKCITVNTCKDHLKSKQFKQNKKTDFEETSFFHIKDKKLAPDRLLITNERQKTIINAIENLKPGLKQVIILYDIKEMSYEEISRNIECPVGTVKSRLFNARKQLRNELKELLN